MEMRDPAFGEFSIAVAQIECPADEIAELLQVNRVGLSGSFRALASSEMRFQEGYDGVSN